MNFIRQLSEAEGGVVPEGMDEVAVVGLGFQSLQQITVLQLACDFGLAVLIPPTAQRFVHLDFALPGVDEVVPQVEEQRQSACETQDHESDDSSELSSCMLLVASSLL